jgi:hypothetical protein
MWDVARVHAELFKDRPAALFDQAAQVRKHPERRPACFHALDVT